MLTLLLDLDNTLLENGTDTFLPGYLGLLSRELAPYADPSKMVRELLTATAGMVHNRRPDCTLREIFDHAFYPALGLKGEDLRHVIDRFYDEIYPGLEGLTRARPAARKLVEAAFERGYRVAIATNPLYPRTAVLQRLKWAGLPIEEFPFEVVTSYEDFHFAKPHVAYYAEILGRMGWPKGPVLMVGDDLENDILPARRLGLPAYWVQPALDAVTAEDTATVRGPLDQVLGWIDQSGVNGLEPNYNDPPSMLATLRSTPAVLDSLCRNLSEPGWKSHPEPDEWCLTEVVYHLRDVEGEVNLPRLRKVLEENNPFLPGEDTDPWAKERQYALQNGPRGFMRFIALRLETLDLLESLSEADWQRTARHAIFGPTPLKELVGIMAAHDRLHVQQAQETVGEK